MLYTPPSREDNNKNRALAFLELQIYTNTASLHRSQHNMQNFVSLLPKFHIMPTDNHTCMHTHERPKAYTAGCATLLYTPAAIDVIVKGHVLSIYIHYIAQERLCAWQLMHRSPSHCRWHACVGYPHCMILRFV